MYDIIRNLLHTYFHALKFSIAMVMSSNLGVQSLTNVFRHLLLLLMIMQLQTIKAISSAYSSPPAAASVRAKSALSPLLMAAFAAKLRKSRNLRSNER